MGRTSLAEYLDNFYKFRHDTAYAHPRGYRTARWSYGDVASAASQFARELEASGIGKGDRVMIWGSNSAEWVVAFFGCVLRGVVVVPMDRICSADFAMRVYAQVGAKLLVADRALAECHAGPSLHLEGLREALVRHASSRYPAADTQRSDPLQIIFTSGTTADPKGVVITHGNVLANLEPFEGEVTPYLRYEWIFHPIRFLNLLPLSHVFGQFLGLFIPQLFGGMVVFQETLNPSEVMRTIRRERISVLVAVPRMLESLKDKIERDLEAKGLVEWFRREYQAAASYKAAKKWWRFWNIHRRFGIKFWAFVSGGAALDARVEEFWRRLGFAVLQGYGLTETTSLISVNHPFRSAKGTIGKVLPGRDIKLDPATGEILVRGEGVASGYWQGSQLTPVVDAEGWFRTGDLGELDAQGNLLFKGRQKNVIVTPEGMKVHPQDLEAALRKQPEVRDVVVIGLERNGNAEPVAVMIARDTGDLSAAVKRANDSLAEFQHIRRWYRWPEEDFPRTSTQKPRTNIIQEFVRSQLGATSAVAAAAQGSLAELIGKVTGRQPSGLSSDASLGEDLRLSSLDRVELLAAIEDRYQVDLNETTFAQLGTVGELERMLREPVTAERRTEFTYPVWPQRWPMTWIRPIVNYGLGYPAQLIMSWPRVIGRENLRAVRGPVLIICNHITQNDIGFIKFALPPRLRQKLAVAMGGELLWTRKHPPAERGLVGGLWDRITYWLLVALMVVFPLPQRSGFREAFAFAGESADRGYSVLVFPEGARTTDGRIQRFRSGIGMLVNRLNLPVVPMRIDGLFELKQKKQYFSRPGTITVRIGAPIRFDPEAEPEHIAQELENVVRSL